MKVKNIGANKTVIELDNGNEIFVSYQTPVAAFISGRGYVKTSKSWSVTTSKHITQWAGKQVTQTEPQEFFDNLLNPPKPEEKIDWLRIDNNASGHPRYVCHFGALNSKEESDSMMSVSDKYACALARAKRIGGKKYHNKKYGGGIAFVSFNMDETEKAIREALKN